MMTYKELYLAHHGIKGQQWGVRNGPPYPIENHKKRRGKTIRSFSKQSEIDRDDYKVNRTHLSSYNEYKNYKHVVNVSDVGDYNLKNVAELIDKNPDFLRRVKKQGNHLIDRNDLNAVNYGYYANNGNLGDNYKDSGLHNNCGKCSAALFLRSKGYDVIAGKSRYGVSSTAQEYWFDNAIPYKEKGYENIERRIKKFGNHGQGTIGIRRADGSGHSVYFQHEAGKTWYCDGQNGNIYSSLKSLLDAEQADLSQFQRITNLTNATPNWKHLAEDNVIRTWWKNDNTNLTKLNSINKFVRDVDIRFGDERPEMNEPDTYRWSKSYVSGYAQEDVDKIWM